MQLLRFLYTIIQDGPKRIKRVRNEERYSSGRLRGQPLAGTMEKWGDRNLSITADLCDVNDAVKLVDLIT